MILPKSTPRKSPRWFCRGCEQYRHPRGGRWIGRETWRCRLCAARLAYLEAIEQTNR